MIDRYIEEYCRGFDFKPYEKQSQEICGITIENDIMLFSEGINRRTRSHAVFKKGNMVYECDRVDTEIPIISLITV